MKSLQKNIKFYTIILIVVYLLVAGINYYFNRDLTAEAFVKMLLSVFMITTSIYVSNAFVMYLFFAKVKIEHENTKYALGYWVQIVTALIVSIVIDVVQKIWIYHVPINDALNRIYSLQMMPQYFFVFCISTIVYFFLIYKSKQENKVREHKIVAQSASAKFETLKSQIDPHFLFNSLNVLSSLIEENPNKAQQFTIALSKTYRYVLEQRNKDLVDLQEELAFAKTFEKLLKLRFEDALEIILPSETIDSDAKVIPLVLQLLLENAVKHNIINSNQKLIIKVEVKDDALVVSNNFQPKNVLKDESTGFGLQHIIQQYDLVTNRKVLITQTNNCFEVYLPILTEQIATEVNPDLEYQTDEIIYKKAKARLKELKNFYTSIGTFVIFSIIYIVIRFLAINHPMFYWMPMAIAVYAFILIIQAINIFGLRNWEQNMITKLMNQQNKNK
jgi:hypothetical protein